MQVFMDIENFKINLNFNTTSSPISNIEFDYDEIINQIKNMNALHEKIENQCIDRIIEEYPTLDRDTAKYLYEMYKTLTEDEFKKQIPVIVNNKEYFTYPSQLYGLNIKKIEVIKILD